jgi:hypothetical protein
MHNAGRTNIFTAHHARWPSAIMRLPKVVTPRIYDEFASFVPPPNPRHEVTAITTADNRWLRCINHFAT